MRYDFFQLSNEQIETINKLMQLHDMIPTIPDKEFDMRHWWWPANNCRTTGCVVGHGVHRGILKQINIFDLEESDDPFVYIRDYEFPLLSWYDIDNMFHPTYVRTKLEAQAAIMRVIHKLIGVNP